MKPEHKIHKAYYQSQKTTLYYNQIKDLSGLSDSSLTNTLNRLVNDGRLTKEKTKAITNYHIKDRKYFSLRFAELAYEQFTQLKRAIRIPLQHFLIDLPEDIHTIVLFGSAAKGQETKNSDIDLLIVTNRKTDLSKNRREAELTSPHPLSLFTTTLQEFKVNTDDVVTQARKTGFPIHKEQNFYEDLNGD